MTGGRTTAGKLTCQGSGALFIPGSVAKVAAEVDAKVAVGVGDSLEYVCRTETQFHLFL